MLSITLGRTNVKTTVLFDATRRHPAPSTFGRGLIASRPTHRAPASFADMDWAAQAFRGQEQDWDERAARASIEAGYSYC